MEIVGECISPMAYIPGLIPGIIRGSEVGGRGGLARPIVSFRSCAG